MPGPISLDTAWFIAVFLDMALCGAYNVIFVLTLWVARGRRWYFSPPFLVIYISYLLNLARTVMLLITTYIIFIERPRDTVIYFQDHNIALPSAPLIAFDRYSWNALSFLGYLTLMWRLWIVWSKSIKILIIPVLLLLISFATSVLSVYPKRDDVGQLRLISCLVLGLDAILNILLAGLISGKIWIEGKRKPVFRRVAVVVLEGGIVMSLGMIVTLITFAIETNGLTIAYTAMAKIMGMSATGIVLLLNLESEQNSDDTCKTGTTFAFRHPDPTSTNRPSEVEP